MVRGEDVLSIKDGLTRLDNLRLVRHNQMIVSLFLTMLVDR